MIRRDYILRMLAEFFEVLSRLRALQKSQKLGEAGLLADREYQQLIGGDAQGAVQLTETELLARLIKSESTLVVREKALMLATLLKESGDIAAAEPQPEKSRAFYLKGLHVLLGVLAREDVFEFPEFVPRVEGFLSALGDAPLPMTTQAMLMQHYERIGDFARAEDMLFSMIEDQSDNSELLDFGAGFYRRLQQQSNDALIAGNLPRPELDAGLAQILQRKAAQSRPA